MKNITLKLFLLFLPTILFAQTPHPWELGGGIGVGVYHGDLQSAKNNLSSQELGFAISALCRRHLSNNFAARFGLLYTGLSAKDENFPDSDSRQARGFSFESGLVELAVAGEIYPFGKYKKDKRGALTNSPMLVTPFLSLGVGGVFFTPTNDWNAANDNGGVDPLRIQTDINDIKKAGLSIPMGGGLRFRATHRVALGLEGTLRYTTSDFLDGVSAAGDPGKKDWFYTVQATASFAFGKEGKPSSYRRRQSNADDKIPSADADSDGVADDKDDCPDIPGLRSLKGCPDADRDGVTDAYDLCPDVAGLSTLFGCPDRDEDGIPDKDDNCPDVKGVEAYRGCPPVDRDKDGVADAEDLCPDMSGELRWKGCPDSDNDGIPDNKDACPGIAGPDFLRGCPDTDDDGIPDKDDECPTIPGLPEKKGCPEAPPPSPGVPYKAVYFGSTLEEWQITSLITIDEVIFHLEADPALFARIEGHTDNTGKEPANDLLAEKRAKKCLDYLVSKGIAPERLNYVGFGSKKPAVPNDTREHRQLNRRVEIHFYKK